MNTHNDDYLKDFGVFIREGREKQKLSQTEVATRVGIKQPYYCQIERGERNAYFTLALEICKTLNLDINKFIKKYM